MMILNHEGERTANTGSEQFDLCPPVYIFYGAALSSFLAAVAGEVPPRDFEIIGETHATRSVDRVNILSLYSLDLPKREANKSRVI